MDATRDDDPDACAFYALALLGETRSKGGYLTPEQVGKGREEFGAWRLHATVACLGAGLKLNTHTGVQVHGDAQAKA